MVKLEDCESLFTHHRNKKAICEENLVRDFSGIQQALGNGELDNDYWIP